MIVPESAILADFGALVAEFDATRAPSRSFAGRAGESAAAASRRAPLVPPT